MITIPRITAPDASQRYPELSSELAGTAIDNDIRTIVLSFAILFIVGSTLVYLSSKSLSITLMATLVLFLASFSLFNYFYEKSEDINPVIVGEALTAADKQDQELMSLPEEEDFHTEINKLISSTGYTPEEICQENDNSVICGGEYKYSTVEWGEQGNKHILVPRKEYDDNTDTITVSYSYHSRTIDNQENGE